MRLNKLISDSGLCSRREADELIEAGRVTVNGVVAELGQLLVEGEVVLVDGHELPKRKRRAGRRHVYIALNKPVGIICTTDESVSGNIVEHVGHEQRIFPIGRLDKDSEGLILLTSNGDIVNQILRSENHLEKEYLVAVNKPVESDFLAGMAKGVRIHGQLTQPCRTARLAKFGFRIILTQGLNRQIRLMSAAFGYRVKQLCRVRIGQIQLGTLKPGRWRNLTDAELATILPRREEW